jgi:phage anti-repressor protein
MSQISLTVSMVDFGETDKWAVSTKELYEAFSPRYSLKGDIWADKLCLEEGLQRGQDYIGYKTPLLNSKGTLIWEHDYHLALDKAIEVVALKSEDNPSTAPEILVYLTKMKILLDREASKLAPVSELSLEELEVQGALKAAFAAASSKITGEQPVTEFSLVTTEEPPALEAMIESQERNLFSPGNVYTFRAKTNTVEWEEITEPILDAAPIVEVHIPTIPEALPPLRDGGLDLSSKKRKKAKKKAKRRNKHRR